MRRIPAALVAVLVVVGLGAAACGGDDDDSSSASGSSTTAAAQQSTVTVTASGFAFSPATATAKAGNVHFDVTNKDDTKHTFTIDGTSVDIQLDGGTSGKADADLKAGSYEWHCTIHSNMTGKLTVS